MGLYFYVVSGTFRYENIYDIVTLCKKYVIKYSDPDLGYVGREGVILSAAMMDISVAIDLGPVEEWKTPYEAVSWLHREVLTSSEFKLSELEKGQRWADEIARCGLMTKRDALIILEFARFTRTESEADKLADAAKKLDAMLNNFVDVQSLQDKVRTWAQSLGSRIGQERVRAICHMVYLGRRWSR